MMHVATTTTQTQSAAEADAQAPQVPPAPKLRPQQAPADFTSFNIQLASHDQLSNGNCNTALCSASNCSVSEGLSQSSQILELQREALSQGSYNMQCNNSWNNNNIVTSSAANGTTTNTSQSVSLPHVESIMGSGGPSADQISSMSMQQQMELSQ